NSSVIYGITSGCAAVVCVPVTPVGLAPMTTDEPALTVIDWPVNGDCSVSSTTPPAFDARMLAGSWEFSAATSPAISVTSAVSDIGHVPSCTTLKAAGVAAKSNVDGADEPVRVLAEPGLAGTAGLYGA